jgi:hypothetical protein
LIEQVARAQRDAIGKVVDPPHVRGAEPPDDAEDFIPPLEEQLGEIGTILSGDTGDNRTLSHVS